MEVKVNAATIQKALDDERYKNELIEYLNAVVEEELEKGDRMDTDLVTDCTELIFDLENGYEELNIKRETADKIVKFCRKQTKTRSVNKRMIALFAAVLIITSTLSATVFADEIEAFVQQIISMIERGDSETAEPDSGVSYLSITHPDVMEVKDGELDLTGVEVTVHYKASAGREPEVVSLEQCKPEQEPIVEDGETVGIAVSVSYKGKTEGFEYFFEE